MGSWKITATSLPRTSRMLPDFSPSNSLPESFTLPRTRLLLGSKPSRAMELALLPEPDSPTIARTSPALTS